MFDMKVFIYNNIFDSNCLRTIESKYRSINDDGEINVIDVVLLVSNILENTYNENANINQDDLLNVLDVVLLVDMILNPTNIDTLDSAFLDLIMHCQVYCVINQELS